LRWYDVEHLGHGLADEMAFSPARAGLVLHIDADLDAWQMLGQHAAIARRRFTRLLRCGCSGALILGAAGLTRRGCRCPSHVKNELKLIRIELFRTPPEQGALEFSKDEQELLVLQQRRIALGSDLLGSAGQLEKFCFELIRI